MELTLKHRGLLDIAKGQSTMSVMVDLADGAETDEKSRTEPALSV